MTVHFHQPIVPWNHTMEQEKMYDRMIVPLDGSHLAEQVLPYVHVVGKGLQCPITLVRVFDVPAMLEGVAGSTIDRVADELRTNAGRY